MKEEYPAGKADLMAAFMIRSQSLTRHGGTWGMINLPSWMSLKSFESLRRGLLGTQRVASLLHLGRGVFGSDFGTVAFVVDNRTAIGLHGIYRRLFEQHVEVRSVDSIKRLFLDPSYNRFEVSQEDFTTIPGSPIVYWLSEKMRATFKGGQSFGDIAEVLVGLRTGDNARFLRFWWEVDQQRTMLQCWSLAEAKISGRRWFPYNKGGSFRRWYGNHEYVVNWENDGREIEEGLAQRYPYLVPSGQSIVRGQGRSRYFSPSVSWSKVSSGAPAFRVYPPGFVFDVAGTSMFAESLRERIALLAFANSQLAFEQLSALAPTLNFEVGQVANLPHREEMTYELSERALELVSNSQGDWDSFETSWNFHSNPLVSRAMASTLE